MAMDLAHHMFAALEQLRIHPTGKRIRAYTDGALAVDSTRAVIVWEPRRVVPSYAVPVEDLTVSLADPGEALEGGAEHPVRMGEGPPVLDPRSPFSVHSTAGQSFDLAAGRVLPSAAFSPDDPDLAGYVVLDFAAFDEWREEDELLVAHARDPFKTVDTRRSSRQVEVEVAGVTVADTKQSTMLFETYLPTRYYLPRDQVRMDLLQPSSRVTACAYKGITKHWSVVIDDAVAAADVAWAYDEPHNYAVSVKGMVAFYNERPEVTVSVDGVRQERPVTPWS